jgi:hypothetical protein
VSTLGQRLKIELDDGTSVETEYDGRDIRQWEAKSRKSWFAETKSLSILTWVAHHAAVRRGDLNGPLSTYEAFDAVCVSLEALPDREDPKDPEDEEADEETDPTEASPTSPGDGSSSP